MNTPTPETDAAKWTAARYSTNDYVQVVDASVAAKLERERDEAKEKLDVIKDALCRANVIAAGRLEERDQLRKVADDFANRIRNVRPIVREDESREDWIDCQIDEMLRDYNSLPHVIEKKGKE